MSDDGPYAGFRITPWPEPWVSIPDVESRALLEAQLRTEVADGHPLFGKAVIAVGRCDGCDDVVFSVEEDPGWFALVHLTWQATPATPPWPRSERLSSPLSRSLVDHHH